MAVAAAPLPLKAAPAAGTRTVRAWLFLLAALVLAMVAIGGTTRLTGSGLSITEWKPVTGAIPPLSETAWAAEFQKYRQSPQYQLLNEGMSLAEFKWIYGWEWGHRQLGRFLGLAFFLPLAAFWWRGLLSHRLALTLVGVGALGGLQAAVGWIMVASGLEPGMTAVAPLKLMLHLTIAAAIFCCLVWIATGLRVTSPVAGEVGRRSLPGEGGASSLAPKALLALVLLQIALGGLVAGSKAGLTYNTWPLMDGELLPSTAALFAVTPWVENFVHNPTLVQFNHRLVAYILVAFALWHAFATRHRRAVVIAGLIVAQMVLGIVTLLLVVPLWAGLAHQLLAFGVLGMAVVHARLSALKPA